jgi:hypothetical protein
MKLSRHINGVTSRIVALSVLPILAILVGQHLAAEEMASRDEPSQLAKDMIGTWILVGTPDDVGEPPAAGGMLKFLTGKHWCVTQANPDTNVVQHHHGGTYTLKGDEYVETVQYANESTAQIIKSVNRFKVTVEGDTLTQIGIGNPWSQVWKRLK